MDLRSGAPYWLLKNGLLGDFPRLRHNEQCDVVILGGGVTGALAAHYLVEAGADVVLLDRRDIGAGSTAASTALLQYAADTDLIDLIDFVGEANAVQSYRLGRRAVDLLEEMVRSLDDDCGFERKQTLYLASRQSDLPKLRKEFEVRAAHGFEVEFLEPTQIQERYPFSAPGAILSANDAQIDAYRLTHGLIKRAAKLGLRVYDRSEVHKIKTTKTGMLLETENGFTITAKRTVFATGYESQKYLKQRVGSLHSTYAFISEPLEPLPIWPDRCLIWETARPYLYLRTTSDNRVIVGGGDTPYATDHRQASLLKRKTRHLASRFKKMFKSDVEVDYTWAGTFGSTKDGLAYIGRSPEWPHAFFALGYGGNGITYSVIAAELIRDAYLGTHNPDAAIFRFDR